MKRNSYAMGLIIAAMVLAPVLRAETNNSRIDPTNNNYDRNVSRRDATVNIVDIPGNQVELRDATGKTHVYPLSTDVSIRGENGTLTIADLKPGDSVSVVENEKGQLSSILITSPTTQRYPPR